MSYPKFALLVLLAFAGAAQAEQICRKTTARDSSLQIRSDGTVVDHRNGLQWLRCPLGARGALCDKGETLRLSAMKAEDQIYRINQAGFAGHKDWRLPTVKELGSLVSRDCVNPAIDLKLFPNTPPLWFWTSSHDEGDSSSARYIDFKSGFSDEDDRNLANPVRLVRSMKSTPR